MRVVLYSDEDMEPITVIELSEFAANYLSSYKEVTLPVIRNITASIFDDDPIINKTEFKQVKIRSETFIRKGQKYMMLFTQDEESALLLKSCFLPGQQSELNEVMKDEFAKGFLCALNRIGYV